jgi:hypothetical protein
VEHARAVISKVSIKTVPDLKDGRQRPIGADLRKFIGDLQSQHAAAINPLSREHDIFLPTYGPAVALDLSKGGIQKIVVTNGNAFTVSAPVNIGDLAHWTLVILNSSGGAMGAVTFAAAIHQNGFSAPSNGLRTSARFWLDGTTHFQVGTWSPAL